jgi:hypothetical protein
MMEAVRTSETSVDNHFTRQYDPEDSSEHHTRRRENLKPHTIPVTLPIFDKDSAGENEWIFSSFSMDAVSKAKATDDLQYNILDMTTDRRFQTILKEKSVSEFWCEVRKDYPSPGRSAVTALLPFGATYLC